MARLKIVDTASAANLYNDLFKGLDGKGSVEVGHNTRLVLRSDGCIGLRLYSTDVVVVHPDNEVDYQTGGYLTVTTVERISHIARLFGQCASRAGGQLTIGPRKVRKSAMCLSQGQAECVCDEGQQELDTMIAQVATEAFPAVIDAYQAAVSEWANGPDWEVADEDFDLYLYVYANGTWTIDRPDYLQDHRDIVASVLVGGYESVDTLRMELEGSTF